MKKSCPSDRILMEYCDGDISPEQAEAIEKHLESCAECKAVAEEFKAGLWAVKAVMEAGSKAVEGRSVAESVMAKVRSDKPGRRTAGWAAAIAAAAALIFIFIAGIKDTGSKRPIPAEPAVSNTATTRLVVNVEPGKLEIEDSIGGVKRSVYVQP